MEELQRFDRFFSEISGPELKAVCDTAPEDMATWIMIQEKMLESARKLREIMERAKDPAKGEN